MDYLLTVDVYSISEYNVLELHTCTVCIFSQYHRDKTFHFPGKFHFLVTRITDSVRLRLVDLNLVLSTSLAFLESRSAKQARLISHFQFNQHDSSLCHVNAASHIL